MNNKKRWIQAAAVTLAAMAMSGCAAKEAGKLTKQGMEAVEQQNYKDALKLFQEAVNNNENLIMAYRGAGMAYMGLADYESAVKAFDLALDETDGKMPDTVADIQLYKASAQFRMEDYEGTEDTSSEILDVEENATAYFLRGASYLNEGNQERAKEDFNQAVLLTPSDYDLYLNIYETYETLNLSALGDEYLQGALELQGSTAEDAYNQGRIYFYLEDYEKAQSVLQSAVEEKNEDGMYLMARVYLAQGDPLHAKGIYEQIMESFGESPKVYNGIAASEIAQENYDAALEAIQTGLALDGEAGKKDLRFNEIIAYEYKLDFATAKEKAAEYIVRYPSDEAGRKEYAFLSTRS